MVLTCTHTSTAGTHVYSAAAAAHWLRILHNATAFNELIRILLSLYAQRFEVSGTFLFQKALLSRSFTVSLRLMSSSSRLDSNCLWVRTGLDPPVATCLWSSGHSLGLRHKRKGWRPAENNIYPAALVKTRLTPILCLSLCLSWWVLSSIKDVQEWAGSGYWVLSTVIKGSYLRMKGFYSLPPSICATAKETMKHIDC